MRRASRRRSPVSSAAGLRRRSCGPGRPPRWKSGASPTTSSKRTAGGGPPAGRAAFATRRAGSSRFPLGRTACGAARCGRGPRTVGSTRGRSRCRGRSTPGPPPLSPSTRSKAEWAGRLRSGLSRASSRDSAVTSSCSIRSRSAGARALLRRRNRARCPRSSLRARGHGQDRPRTAGDLLRDGRRGGGHAHPLPCGHDGRELRRAPRVPRLRAARSGRAKRRRGGAPSDSGAIRARHLPDYIFLDARAGLHDLGGLSLHALAHVDVLVGRAGAATLDGFRLVLGPLAPATG